ncbi:MAG: DivIVA domain-containing protein [Clostridia bacterium]|nr:DivIVA domain-containing protein [Clostridia bacterium]
MITPVDIQNKEFPKKISGYDRISVDEFMLEVAEAYEKIYRENIDLKDKLSNLNESLRKYIAMEDAMQNTLMFAQNTADDVKKSATEKAEIMVKEAELKAKEVTCNAQNKVLEQERKLEELKNEINIYKTKFESLISAQKALIDEMFNA